MKGKFEPKKVFPPPIESTESSVSEVDIAGRSYGFSSGVPEEPVTSDEDSDDSGGGNGRFSRVFVVNPDTDESSSELEDNADSTGIEYENSHDNNFDRTISLQPSG